MGLFARFVRGGDFAFVEVYSADASSNRYVVDMQFSEPELAVLAFSDNGCGDDYVFAVENGVAADVVLFHDHETGLVWPEVDPQQRGPSAGRRTAPRRTAYGRLRCRRVLKCSQRARAKGAPHEP